jgi:hypothetical protein
MKYKKVTKKARKLGGKADEKWKYDWSGHKASTSLQPVLQLRRNGAMPPLPYMPS